MSEVELGVVGKIYRLEFVNNKILLSWCEPEVKSKFKYYVYLEDGKYHLCTKTGKVYVSLTDYPYGGNSYIKEACNRILTEDSDRKRNRNNVNISISGSIDIHNIQYIGKYKDLSSEQRNSVCRIKSLLTELRLVDLELIALNKIKEIGGDY